MNTDNNDDLTFGKRFGIEPVKVPFQVKEIYYDLRIELWNAFFIYIQTPLEQTAEYRKDEVRVLHQKIWIHFLKRAFDDFPHDSEFGKTIKKFILEKEWYKVYELKK
jgi:hypothetical protein